MTDEVILPMRAAKPRALDWNYRSRLNKEQAALLLVFQALSKERKEELMRGLGPDDAIPASKITQARQ